MTEYYNIKENQELHQIREPYLGQIVAANFLTDNKWYRAEIIAIQPNDSDEMVLDVYFLDYGDQQFVSKKDILELRADFLSLRFQAVECFLAHIQPTQTGSKFEEWDQKAIGAFEDMVKVAQWKKLISKVVTYKERKSFALQRQKHRESSPVPGVELYEENSDKSIALELVKAGHAELSDRFGDIAKSLVLTVIEDEPKEEEIVAPAEEIVDPVEEIAVEIPEPVEEKNEEVPQEPQIIEQKITQEEPKEEEPSLPNSSNLDQPSSNSITNGKSADVFGAGDSKVKPKKKKKQITADFLNMEQQQQSAPSHKKKSQDWNQMMEE